jgi:uncharacterized membrane protein
MTLLLPAAAPGRPEIDATRRARLPWVLGASVTLVYAVLAVSRHELLLTHGYDLGIFEQGVRGYAEGVGPLSSLKGPAFSLLGDHFSPIMAVLAPAYRLWASPVVLLVAQAALLGLAVVPLARWALTAFGRGAAVTVTMLFSLSFGITSMVAFDVHEVMFAVPLLAWSLTALGQGRHRATVGWALPLLLVKEDLGLTVSVIGAVVAMRGTRRLGVTTIVAGLLGTAVEIIVLIPLVNPSHTYAYGGQLAGSVGGEAGLLGELAGVVDPSRWTTFSLLLVPTLGLALRSPLLLVAAPTLAWRLLTANPAYASPAYHYNGVLVPIVVAAFIHAVSCRDVFGWRLTPHARTWLLATVAAVALALGATSLAPMVTSVVDGSRWAASATARAALDAIPVGDSVLTSNDVAPQLTATHDVTLIGLSSLSDPCPLWIVDEVGQGEYTGQAWPVSVDERHRQVEAALAAYRVVHDDGWIRVLRYAGEPDRSVRRSAGPPAWTCVPAR